MPSFFRHSSFDSHYHLEVHLGICIVQVFAFCDPAYCNAGWLQGWQMLQGCTAGWRQGNDAAYPAAEDETQETHDTCASEWWGSSTKRCWNRNEIYWESRVWRTVKYFNFVEESFYDLCSTITIEIKSANMKVGRPGKTVNWISIRNNEPSKWWQATTKETFFLAQSCTVKFTSCLNFYWLFT